MKVFIEEPDMAKEAYSHMFINNGWEVTENLDETDLLCLTGGADIDPQRYGHENTASYVDLGRDSLSFELLAYAHSQGIPVVGICRGAQVLCVYHGGRMLQHIDGHNGNIPVEFRGVTYQMPCSHHQAMVLNSALIDYEKWCSDGGAPEIVIWKGPCRMLGFQPHPEYVSKGHSAQKLFFLLVKEVCFP